LLCGHNNFTRVVCYLDILNDRRYTFEYCVSIGDNLITWKNKKQNVVAKSNVETEYRTMTSITCELKELLKELQFGEVN